MDDSRTKKVQKLEEQVIEMLSKTAPSAKINLMEQKFTLDSYFNSKTKKQTILSVPGNSMTKAFLTASFPNILEKIHYDGEIMAMIRKELDTEAANISFSEFPDWAKDKTFKTIREKLGKPYGVFIS